MSSAQLKRACEEAAKMRNREREIAAEAVADCVLAQFEGKSAKLHDEWGDFADGLDVGIILGTGWGDVLFDEMGSHMTFPLEKLPRFDYLEELPKIEGHHRELIVTELKGKKVALLRGRLHMNESHNSEELAKVVRLQVEMLIKLGVKHLILTNAAGSLRPKVKIGNVVAHDGFVTLFAPPLPLLGGEFVSPEDALKKQNIRKIKRAAKRAKLTCHHGAGAMVRGPFFEGRKYDKKILREFGATMAMMSVLPETAVAALYPEVEVYAVSYITNTDSEEHSHEDNQARAKVSAKKLGSLLLNLVSSL